MFLIVFNLIYLFSKYKYNKTVLKIHDYTDYTLLIVVYQFHILKYLFEHKYIKFKNLSVLFTISVI